MLNLGLSAFFTHEMDAVQAQEWRLLYVLRGLPEAAAYPAFLLLHYLGRAGPLLAATDPNFVAPDKPATPAGRDDRRPILVLVDSRGWLKGWPYWQAQPFWKDWISLCTSQTPQDHIEELRRIGVMPLQIGRHKVDLPLALDILATDYGVGKVRLNVSPNRAR